MYLRKKENATADIWREIMSATGRTRLHNCMTFCDENRDFFDWYGHLIKDLTVADWSIEDNFGISALKYAIVHDWIDWIPDHILEALSLDEWMEYVAPNGAPPSPGSFSASASLFSFFCQHGKLERVPASTRETIPHEEWIPAPETSRGQEIFNSLWRSKAQMQLIPTRIFDKIGYKDFTQNYKSAGAPNTIFDAIVAYSPETLPLIFKPSTKQHEIVHQTRLWRHVPETHRTEPLQLIMNNNMTTLALLKQKQAQKQTRKLSDL